MNKILSISQDQIDGIVDAAIGLADRGFDKDHIVAIICALLIQDGLLSLKDSVDQLNKK